MLRIYYQYFTSSTSLFVISHSITIFNQASQDRSNPSFNLKNTNKISNNVTVDTIVSIDYHYQRPMTDFMPSMSCYSFCFNMYILF